MNDKPHRHGGIFHLADSAIAGSNTARAPEPSAGFVVSE